ncbi:hypothetical protein PFISCL1PPCAC_8529, partial [Pristionchus fissidentatus]
LQMSLTLTEIDDGPLTSARRYYVTDSGAVVQPIWSPRQFVIRFPGDRTQVEQEAWNSVMGAVGNDVYFADTISFPGFYCVKRATVKNNFKVTNLYKLNTDNNYIYNDVPYYFVRRADHLHVFSLDECINDNCEGKTFAIKTYPQSMISMFLHKTHLVIERADPRDGSYVYLHRYTAGSAESLGNYFSISNRQFYQFGERLLRFTARMELCSFNISSFKESVLLSTIGFNWADAVISHISVSGLVFIRARVNEEQRTRVYTVQLPKDFAEEPIFLNEMRAPAELGIAPEEDQDEEKVELRSENERLKKENEELERKYKKLLMMVARTEES